MPTSTPLADRPTDPFFAPSRPTPSATHTGLAAFRSPMLGVLRAARRAVASGRGRGRTLTDLAHTSGIPLAVQDRRVFLEKIAIGWRCSEG